MRREAADLFGELRLFYQLCYVGLLTTGVTLIFVVWNVARRYALLAPVLAAALVAALLGLYLASGARQRRIQRERLAAAGPERPRLRARLDPLRERLRQLCGREDVRLVMTPEPAIVLSTLHVEGSPVIELSAGFWSTYSGSPERVEAALAHEAGHVVAGDVPIFLRLLRLMRAFTLLAPAIAAGAVLVYAARGPVAGVSLSFLVGTLAVSTVALALSWSALLVARELQADAYAVHALGVERPVRELLMDQLQRRRAQAEARPVLRRLRTWLLQPDLGWRATLPALHGRVGRRVEVKLGLATSGCLLVVLWLASFVSFSLGERRGVSMALGAVAVLWLSWIAYAFFWGRSRALGGRRPGAFLGSLASTITFSLSGLALFLLEYTARLLALGRELRRFEMQGTAEAILFVLLLPLTSLLLWAAGKLALVSGRERRRSRPSPWRALIAVVVLAILHFPSVVIPFTPSWIADERVRILLDGVIAAVLVALVAGLVAHLVTPPSKPERRHGARWLRERRV